MPDQPSPPTSSGAESPPPHPAPTASPTAPPSNAQESLPVQLPRVRTALEPGKVREVLESAARRGKLAGLEFDDGGDGRTFAVTDFGQPFEGVLVAVVSGGASGSEIAFRTRVKPLMPAVFLFILVITVWPGVVLTDSMLRKYFPSYEIRTWWWYLPLTVLPAPWAWRSAWRKSQGSILEEAHKIVGQIVKLVDGTTGG